MNLICDNVVVDKIVKGVSDMNLKRILIVTAVSAERDAVLKGLNGNNRFDVIAGGVGPMSAAVSTARALTSEEYGLVISAGIAGGFNGRADIGSLVLANEIIAADLGVQTDQGFSSLDELGFGSTRIPVDTSIIEQLSEVLQEAKLTITTGPILTLSTVTGTKEIAEELASRVPGATAEAMEGFGVATAAVDFNLPVLEIRAISNLVGPRDRENWRIKEALDALTSAFSIIKEVI